MIICVPGEYYIYETDAAPSEAELTSFFQDLNENDIMGNTVVAIQETYVNIPPKVIGMSIITPDFFDGGIPAGIVKLGRREFTVYFRGCASKRG